MNQSKAVPFLVSWFLNSARLHTLRIFARLVAPTMAWAAPPPLLDYNTLPLGTAEAPLVMRTFAPDPGIDEAVFAHHGRGKEARKYDIEAGKDTSTVVPTVNGIPAAIAVNHGPALSYVFDTTEGRVLYAWQGGFLDMFPYWGDQKLGNRVAYDYVPRLVGTVFYQAAGRHPLSINGQNVAAFGPPRFIGYDLVNGEPEFIVRFGPNTVRTRVRRPLEPQAGFTLEISVEPPAALALSNEDPRFTLTQKPAAPGKLHATLTGTSLGSFAGYPRKTNLTAATVTAGEQLARTYGCVGCHSTDGSGGHGPTWAGLFNRDRPIAGGAMARADDAYLLESIRAPNAKVVQGFAPNFMPAYSLKDLEYQSLVLFIKSLGERK